MTLDPRGRPKGRTKTQITLTVDTEVYEVFTDLCWDQHVKRSHVFNKLLYDYCAMCNRPLSRVVKPVLVKKTAIVEAPAKGGSNNDGKEEA